MPDKVLLQVVVLESGQLQATWATENKHWQYRLLGGLMGSLVAQEDSEVVERESGTGLIVPDGKLIVPGGH